MDKKLSFILPIYKVEKYLQQCKDRGYAVKTFDGRWHLTENGFLISFEENMACMDLTGASRDSVSKRIESEHQSKDRYIHQLRTDPATRPGIGNYAFFHMEMPDETGELHILPCGYAWSDGVEPVLIDLMNGLTVCSPNGGGGDLLTNPRAFRN